MAAVVPDINAPNISREKGREDREKKLRRAESIYELMLILRYLA